jgi:hypothetical protein
MKVAARVPPKTINTPGRLTNWSGEPPDTTARLMIARPKISPMIVARSIYAVIQLMALGSPVCV